MGCNDKIPGTAMHRGSYKSLQPDLLVLQQPTCNLALSV